MPRIDANDRRLPPFSPAHPSSGNRPPAAASSEPSHIDAIAQHIGGVVGLDGTAHMGRPFRQPVDASVGRTFAASRNWLHASRFDLTASSIAMIRARSTVDYDFITPLANIVGWGSLPFTLPIDLIKAPFTLAGAGLLGAIGGLRHLTKAMSGRHVDRALDALFDSVLLRMPATLTILCAAGLESPESLQQALLAGRHGQLLALALMHTAFISRGLPEGKLNLAEGASLSRTSCPRAGLNLFGCTVALQRTFKRNAPPVSATDTAIAEFVARRLPRFYGVLTGRSVGPVPPELAEMVSQINAVEAALAVLPVVYRRAHELTRIATRVRPPVERNLVPAAEPPAAGQGPTGRAATPPQVQPPRARSAPLSEDEVLRAFHQFMVQSVSRNAAIRREDIEMLEPSVIVAAPALALFEAGLVRDAAGLTSCLEDGRTLTLNAETCPANLKPLYRQWELIAQGLRQLNSNEQCYLRAFLVLNDDAHVSQQFPGVTQARQAQLRRQAGDLCRMALHITRRSSFQRRMAADFTLVLEALPTRPTADDHANAAAAASRVSCAEGRRFAEVLLSAAQRNVTRVSGDRLALIALAMTDAMSRQVLVCNHGDFAAATASADVLALRDVLSPLQEAVASLSNLRLQALEQLLGAPAGDTRHVDLQLVEVAEMVTSIAENLASMPSLQDAVAQIYVMAV